MSAAPRPAARPARALPFVLPRFEGTVLPSGLAVRAARWGRRPTVAAAILFPGAGSTADPPGREGTADVTGDTYLGGTRTKTARQLAEALDDLAAVAEVSAGSDSSVARLYVLESDLDAGLALFAEILTEATFPEEEFDKGRRRLIATLQEQRSEPDFLARERLYDRLYPGHPYGTLTPSEKGLLALTRDDVADFARRRLLARAARRSSSAAPPTPEALLAAAGARLRRSPGRGRRRRASRCRRRRASRASRSTSCTGPAPSRRTFSSRGPPSRARARVSPPPSSRTSRSAAERPSRLFHVLREEREPHVRRLLVARRRASSGATSAPRSTAAPR